MPVRSLSSSVLRWPDRDTVRAALDVWFAQVLRQRDDIVMAGYIGSYARGDAGVGSDLDLLIVVSRSAMPFSRRGAEWDTTSLPVPVDLIVYTDDEWRNMPRTGRFYRTVQQEAVWLLDPEPSA